MYLETAASYPPLIPERNKNQKGREKRLVNTAAREETAASSASCSLAADDASRN